MNLRKVRKFKCIVEYKHFIKSWYYDLRKIVYYFYYKIIVILLILYKWKLSQMNFIFVLRIVFKVRIILELNDSTNMYYYCAGPLIPERMARKLYMNTKTIVSVLKLFWIYNAINIFKFRSGDIVLRGTKYKRNAVEIMVRLNHVGL